MSESNWQTWSRLRFEFPYQALVSDVLAMGVGVILGVLLGWWLL